LIVHDVDGAKGAAAPAGPQTDAELFGVAARRAAARESFALCTVVGAARSTPRDAGAKMLVAPDGSICGSVGGGPLEASVIFEAVQLLRNGGDSGTRRFALTTAGDAAEPLPAAPAQGEDLGMKCGGEASIFVDLVRPAARLVLYGAGHVGERVANLATDAGLCTVVIDDRALFAQPQRFPRAAEVRCADLEKDPLGGLRPGPEDFVVILTRCHALDEGVLEAALQTPARYIGLIGSRRKVALILRSIARRLGRDPRGDPRLHAPIGLRLGDKSPGEIAISILAEVLLIKSNGKLAHNRLGSEGRTAVLGVAKGPSF
jgi:xanthine dehydrogenase accessory factor